MCPSEGRRSGNIAVKPRRRESEQDHGLYMYTGHRMDSRLGKMDNWDFAILKYSSKRYDPEEWFFPGSDLADGTIEGAMKAGLGTYP